MKWRSHGANPEKLYQQFDIEMPEDIIDFSTNTNVIKADKKFSIDIEHLIANYPDDESMELRTQIAEDTKVSVDEILMTNGSNSAIYMIVSMYERIGILQPTYGEYERAGKHQKKTIVPIFSLEESSKLEKIDVLILCNPNNPTGKYYDGITMKNLLEKCEKLSIDVVVDEAYVDFLQVRHQALDIHRHKNLYVIRSLTKNYHLSGVRLGYVISTKEKIQKIEKIQPTWSVNALAQKVGLFFLKDKEFLKRTKKYYQKETPRFIREIEKIGCKVEPTDVHFFLMKVENDEHLLRYLLKKGIVLRHTRNFVSLNGEYVRICTREKEKNTKLIEALIEYKKIGKIEI